MQHSEGVTADRAESDDGASDLRLGDAASVSKTVTEADIVLFAGISGDNNPIHLDAEYARTSQFGRRIAHGMLTASFISTVLGTKMPGIGAVYVGQTLHFLAPV
ncbi:MAG TPA: MaoC family dehydratase, partial [Chloroflexota bacterium]|nr:MaoC family dehydratase [Chloroflexota bacterium]